MESMLKNKGMLYDIEDRWQGTALEGYQKLDPKGKGAYGENVVAEIFRMSGSVVIDPENPGHDRIVDSHKTEIKFSVANKDAKTNQPEKDKFMLNHVSVGKDWERLVFMGVNPKISEDSVFVWFTHHDFAKPGGLKDKYFKPQQGGKKVDNDDWICASKNVQKLLSDPMVRDKSEWQMGE